MEVSSAVAGSGEHLTMVAMVDNASGIRIYEIQRETDRHTHTHTHSFLAFIERLDPSAAFETTDHHILLQRLKHFIGIKRTALSLLKSYLFNRDRSQVNNESSPYTKVRHGVPQGTAMQMIHNYTSF